MKYYAYYMYSSYIFIYLIPEPHKARTSAAEKASPSFHKIIMISSNIVNLPILTLAIYDVSELVFR